LRGNHFFAKNRFPRAPSEKNSRRAGFAELRSTQNRLFFYRTAKSGQRQQRKRIKAKSGLKRFSPLAIGEKPFEKGCFPKPLFLNFSGLYRGVVRKPLFCRKSGFKYLRKLARLGKNRAKDFQKRKFSKPSGANIFFLCHYLRRAETASRGGGCGGGRSATVVSKPKVNRGLAAAFGAGRR